MLIAKLTAEDGEVQFFNGADEEETVVVNGDDRLHYAHSVNDPRGDGLPGYMPGRSSFEQRVRKVQEVLGGTLWIHDDWLDKPEDDERQVLH
jgi:hypothetical protein